MSTPKELKERLAREAFQEIMAQRQALLRAFIAETGYRPSEVEQVVYSEGKTVRWSLRKKV